MNNNVNTQLTEKRKKPLKIILEIRIYDAISVLITAEPSIPIIYLITKYYQIQEYIHYWNLFFDTAPQKATSITRRDTENPDSVLLQLIHFHCHDEEFLRASFWVKVYSSLIYI